MWLAAVAIAPSYATAQSMSTAFDGRWAVSLTCEDVQDKRALVKGYTFNFFADIRDGKLMAQYGQSGLPSSLTMAGVVQRDGNVEITVNGRTGNPEYTVGRVQPSTPYSYRMRGKLTDTSGKATRIELRPCEATFFRQQ